MPTGRQTPQANPIPAQKGFEGAEVGMGRLETASEGQAWKWGVTKKEKNGLGCLHILLFTFLIWTVSLIWADLDNRLRLMEKQAGIETKGSVVGRVWRSIKDEEKRKQTP